MFYSKDHTPSDCFFISLFIIYENMPPKNQLISSSYSHRNISLNRIKKSFWSRTIGKKSISYWKYIHPVLFTLVQMMYTCLSHIPKRKVKNKIRKLVHYIHVNDSLSRENVAINLQMDWKTSKLACAQQSNQQRRRMRDKKKLDPQYCRIHWGKHQNE